MADRLQVHLKRVPDGYDFENPKNMRELERVTDTVHNTVFLQRFLRKYHRYIHDHPNAITHTTTYIVKEVSSTASSSKTGCTSRQRPGIIHRRTTNDTPTASRIAAERESVENYLGISTLSLEALLRYPKEPSQPLVVLLTRVMDGLTDHMPPLGIQAHWLSTADARQHRRRDGSTTPTKDA